MSVVQKVIKLLCERGCTLYKAGEACIRGMCFDMTVLSFGDKYVNVYSQSGEGYEWKSEFDNNVEEIVNEYVKFLKTIRIENKIIEINKDFE